MSSTWTDLLHGWNSSLHWYFDFRALATAKTTVWSETHWNTLVDFMAERLEDELFD